MSYDVKCITSIEGFESLENKWKKLEKESNNKNHNTSFDWIYTWWSVFKERNDRQFGHKKELRILLLYKSNNLIGIAPLVKITRKTKYLINKTSIEFIGQQWAGCCIDFIGNLSKNENEIFFNWLYKNDQFDYMFLNYVFRPTKGIKGILKKILKPFLVRWEFKKMDYFIRNNFIISIQEHISPSRDGGKRQTPNIIDDKESLKEIFKFLKKKNVVLYRNRIG